MQVEVCNKRRCGYRYVGYGEVDGVGGVDTQARDGYFSYG